jgi:hypothetical protein
VRTPEGLKIDHVDIDDADATNLSTRAAIIPELLTDQPVLNNDQREALGDLDKEPLQVVEHTDNPKVYITPIQMITNGTTGTTCEVKSCDIGDDKGIRIKEYSTSKPTSERLKLKITKINATTVVNNLVSHPFLETNVHKEMDYEVRRKQSELQQHNENSRQDPCNQKYNQNDLQVVDPIEKQHNQSEPQQSQNEQQENQSEPQQQYQREAQHAQNEPQQTESETQQSQSESIQDKSELRQEQDKSTPDKVLLNQDQLESKHDKVEPRQNQHELGQVRVDQIQKRVESKLTKRSWMIQGMFNFVIT